MENTQTKTPEKRSFVSVEYEYIKTICKNRLSNDLICGIEFRHKIMKFFRTTDGVKVREGQDKNYICPACEAADKAYHYRMLANEQDRKASVYRSRWVARQKS